MYYKEARDLFQIQYSEECAQRGIKERILKDSKILFYLSNAQKYLADTYDLIEANYNLNLTADKYQYTPGTDADDIPTDIRRIDFVLLNDTANTPLDKKNIEGLLPAGGRSSGTPGAWTLYGTNANRIFEIDSTPDKSYADDSTYRVIIHYIKKLWVYTGSSTNTFSDLNFNTADTWGGSFVLPEAEWDDIMIKLAVAEAIGKQAKDLKAEYLTMAEMKAGKKPHYTRNRLKYSFGIPK